MEEAGEGETLELIITTTFQLNVPRRPPAGASAYILVEFADIQIKTKIFKIIGGKDGQHLEDSIICVYADIPLEILLARKQLREVAKKPLRDRSQI